MIKKALRALLWLVLVFFILLLIGGVGLYFYVQNNQERAVKELAGQFGLEVAYASAEPVVFSTYPRVSLRMDSVMVRDLDPKFSEDTLLELTTIEAALDLSKWWRDTLVWESLTVSNGRVFIRGDSTGNYNMGRLPFLKERADTAALEKPHGFFNPLIDMNGMMVSIDQVHLAYHDPRKHKMMGVWFDSVRTNADTISGKHIQLETCLAADVEGLSFNTRKGSYLRGHHLAGCFSITKVGNRWLADTTTIAVGDDAYRVAGDVGPDGLHLRIENQRLDYDRARRLLHDTLQARLGKYHVSGPFAVVADVYKPPGGGNDVDLVLKFATQRQDVRLQQFQFREVTTSGTFYNKLPEALGGNPESTTEFLIETAPTTAVYDGMMIRSPGARVRGWLKDAYLHSPIDMTGSASALARLIGNTEFIFTRGNFTMQTEVNASLNNIEEIVNTSDGQLKLYDLGVKYVPAAASLPLERLMLHKAGKDVRFVLNSGRLTGGVDFTLVGYLDNILPLLLERPADSLKTEVIFHAQRGDWAGLRTLFTGADYFDLPEPREEPLAVQVDRMKKTLLGIGKKFSPHLQMVIDTMNYYDVLALNDFRAGIKFKGNTLVLEKSRVDLPQGMLQLSAEIDLGTDGLTPFDLSVSAAELNLDALQTPLRSFGLKLPEGINKLPEGLDIDFHHAGIINDASGIQAGTNSGKLDFIDTRRRLFSGNLIYKQGAQGLESDLHLAGNPVFVNDIFASTDFFFGTGVFSLDLHTKGIPEDLEELLRQSDLRLSLDSSRVSYAPAGVFVPIRKMEVNAVGDTTHFKLSLLGDASRRSVKIVGEMDRLSAYLFPRAGNPFKLKADFSAERFHIEDLFELVQLEATVNENTEATDTTVFDPQLLLSTTEGVFRAFRPELSLSIDTFQAAPQTHFEELSANVRLADSTLIKVEETGFLLGKGKMKLAATYAIDRHQVSPFTLTWTADSLSVPAMEKALMALGVEPVSKDFGLRGKLSSAGDITGMLNEGNWTFPFGHTHGTVELDLVEGGLGNQPLLQTMGRKLLMKKRFNDVLLGPLHLSATVDSGRLAMPLVEVQSTALQLFVEGDLDTVRGPDLLVSIPLRNIGRGKLTQSPPPTGYALAGRKVYLVLEPDEAGATQVKFRLGRRKYYRDRGQLALLRERKKQEKAERKLARRQRRQSRRAN